MNGLQNKVAIVTGGGSGIGAAMAQAFAAAGAKVVVAGRTGAKVAQVAAAINDSGGAAVPVAVDVSAGNDVQWMVAVAQENFGGVDILVNNAGISPAGRVTDISEAEWDECIAIDLRSVFLGAKYAIPAMQQRGSGVVLNVAGTLGIRPCRNKAAYGAAKAGVLSLASSLAVEWGPKVRVLAVSPGLVQTEQAHLHYGDEAGIAAVGATIPAGRMATPEDIANACVYAGSPLAAYFAGTNLLLHGGGERPAFLAAANTQD